MAEASEFYPDAQFTAEISSRMQVPDRLMVHENGSPPDSPTHSTISAASSSRLTNDFGMTQRNPRLDMQVPDRILVAGGNSHIASKSTPREMQIDAAVLPPTLDHVRLSTPPRSIRLNEHHFPSATDQEEHEATPGQSAQSVGKATRAVEVSMHEMTPQKVGSNQAIKESVVPDTTALASLPENGRDNLNPHEEIKLIRHQMAKLNHRLMAVELENQQQQQREMIMTVVLSAYFFGKFILWINRSL